MTQTPVRRRRLAPEARREEILHIATRLLSERGFNGVALQDVADAAGMAKSGVLHHFPTKDNLLVELLKYRDQGDPSPADLLAIPDLDRATARELLDQVVARNFERPEIVRLFTVLATESLDPAHPAHQYFGERLANLRIAITEVASLIHPNPESAALRIIAFLDGLQLLWLRDETAPVLALWADFADGLFAE
ncbi:TetR family transcriptional regulator (plasmid) [Rathayibacter sp. VKM Ac-2803]|uniref:TetR/AcrR family transcriptional regulator n=1 Tax=Rathayibacter caricis DSM 15933 TaxID=1328867 RepID=A0A2T4UNV4_9MICO|nr:MULTISPECIES: TetR/AcrR family transcriptional regulator [Rathayibacter]MWV51355.1 TetR family transcriptional regulator [Rathayibacter sp. VKM Ac-2803]PTL71191.1 TetR/AcrR family transcriptional regulator [Rathayibacter caricis DSM 15933]